MTEVILKVNQHIVCVSPNFIGAARPLKPGSDKRFSGVGEQFDRQTDKDTDWHIIVLGEMLILSCVCAGQYLVIFSLCFGGKLRLYRTDLVEHLGPANSGGNLRHVRLGMRRFFFVLFLKISLY